MMLTAIAALTMDMNIGLDLDGDSTWMPKVSYEDPYLTILQKHKGRTSKRRFRNIMKMLNRRLSKENERLLASFQVSKARRSDSIFDASSFPPGLFDR